MNSSTDMVPGQPEQPLWSKSILGMKELLEKEMLWLQGSQEGHNEWLWFLGPIFRKSNWLLTIANVSELWSVSLIVYNIHSSFLNKGGSDNQKN